MMEKVYIYPTYTPSRDKSGNLYIKFFHDAFNKEKGLKIINRLWQIGITSIAFNLDADIFIIQWVDLIPGKRLGKVQFVFFLLLVKVISLLKKEVVWVLHNKRAHNNKSSWVDYGMDFMAKNASCVITHSEEGVSFFNEKYPKYKGKCHYIPHPVYTSQIYPSKNNEYDYIVWGTVSKRKNVLEFIKFAITSNEMKSQRILIAGRCSDSQYAKKINETITNSNIVFDNRFYSDEELRNLISQSKIILFTYNGESVLSSGALIYSLNFCKPIIGPNVGSFADLKSIVSVYNKFSEIPHLILKSNAEACKQYISENLWEGFPNKLISFTQYHHKS